MSSDHLAFSHKEVIPLPTAKNVTESYSFLSLIKDYRVVAAVKPLILFGMLPLLTCPTFTVKYSPLYELCIKSSSTKRHLQRQLVSKSGGVFLWPSDLITWVLVCRISSQLISCLSSWPHHSPDYRIRFSEHAEDGESKRFDTANGSSYYT